MQVLYLYIKIPFKIQIYYKKSLIFKPFTTNEFNLYAQSRSLVVGSLIFVLSIIFLIIFSIGCMGRKDCLNFLSMLIITIMPSSAPGNGRKENYHICMFGLCLRIIKFLQMCIRSRRIPINIYIVGLVIRHM